MERRSQFLGLVLVLVAAVAVPALWMALGSGESPPPAPGSGDSGPVGPHVAAATAGAATDGVAGGAVADHGAAEDAVTGPQRSQPVEAAAAAVLEVTVVSTFVATAPTGGGADVRDRPLANVEVAVATEPGASGASAATGPAQHGVTGADGIARFRVPGGHGRLATISAGIGLTATAELATDRVARVTLRCAPRVWVRGEVVDVAGQAIADAEIVWLPWNDRTTSPPRPWLAARSDHLGRFTIGLPAGGRIGAQHATLAPSPLYLIQPERDATLPAPVRTVRLTLLAAQARATGTVVDGRGRPIAGAEVECLSLAGRPAGAALAAPPQRGTTAADGSFAIGHLLPGRVRIAARAAGQGRLQDVFEVQPGATAHLQLRLSGAGAVRGSVRSEDGQPLSGARVATDDDDAFLAVATLSREDGSFALDDLPIGAVPLSARHRGADGVVRRAAVVLDTLPNHPVTWQAVLTADAVGAHLVGDVITASGQPVAGALVVARSGRNRRQAATDAEGRFDLALGEASPCDVHVYRPSGLPGESRLDGTFAALALREVDPTGEPLHLVMPPLPNGLLRGRVVDDQGTGVAATITLWHQERHESVRAVAADDGSFAVPAVPAGTVDALVDAPGEISASRRDLSIGDGPLDLGTITLMAAGSLHGSVLGPDGGAPAKAELSVYLDDQRVVATYAAGTYHFDALPPGDHTVFVQGDGVAAAQFAVTIQAGSDVQQNVELQTGVTRRFAVAVPRDAGRWVSLALRVPGATQTWISGAPVPAGAAGTIEFVACLAPGTYEAIAWGDPGFEARGTVVFSAENTSTVQLAIAKR